MLNKNITFVNIKKLIFILNTMENFVNRLTHLLDYYDHTASSFSDTIGVQRSSLSHLLSGRNKPSLDFIMKIHETFPEVNLYWLLKGELPFIPEEKNRVPTEEKQVEPNRINESESTVLNNTSSNFKEEKKQESTPPYPSNETDNHIEQIVIFYKDGTFKNFNSNR